MKTISLKKVSAVAVAALAIGSFTAIAPANAANFTADVTSLNVKVATATPTQGAVVAVNLGVVLAAQSVVNNNTIQFRAALTTVPAGGSTSVSGNVLTGAGAAATLPTNAAAGTQFDGLTVVAGGGLSIDVNTTSTELAAASVTSSTTVGMGSFRFTPQKSGTYVMTVWHDGGTTPSGIIEAGEVSQTVSITVAAATTLAPASSVLRMNATNTAITANPQTSDAAYTTALDSVPRSGDIGATAATRNAIGQVAVILLNGDGTAAGGNHTVDCQISGSGLCVIDESGTTNIANGVRAMSFTNTGTKNTSVVHLITDGTSGAGTVTIAVTDSVSGVRTVIGTKSFTSFGAVAKLAVSTADWTIGRAGFTTGKAATARAAATTVGNAAAAATVTTTSGTSTSPAFIVKATDANGNAATAAAAPTIVSGTPSVVTGGTCLLDDGSAPTTVSSSTNGVGFYNCEFTTAAAAASGSKATLTIRIVDPADADKFLTTTLDVTVGGSVSTETIAFDKTSYAPGEGMTITRTAKDSAGNPVFDGAAAPAVTFTKSVGGTAPAAGIYVKGTVSSTSSTGLKSVFAPAVGGAFSMNATSGNAAGSALTASSTVTDANAGLLTQIDALNAKIVALNALIAKIMKKLGVK